MTTFLAQLLSERTPLIMGILNVTPDSFSDGGKFATAEKAVTHAKAMIAAGADIIDIGAESSGPDSKHVSESEEWKRLKEILPALQKAAIPFSVDTYKSNIAAQAIAHGASIINDVTGLRGDEQMADVIAAHPEAHICIMYSKNKNARTTFDDYEEDDVVQKIYSFFAERIDYATSKGIHREQIILDPGMGAFLSSDPQKSFEVIAKLSEFKKLHLPLLIGPSRKSYLRVVSDPENPKNRLIASVTAALLCAQNGADIVRVHDVTETREVFETWKETEKFRDSHI